MLAKHFFSGLIVASPMLLANTSLASQNEIEAYDSCRKAISKEIGVPRYSAFERKYAKVRLSDGNYRFFINSSYRHPDSDGVQIFRSVCESGGFARLNTITVQPGMWALNELANDPSKARDALLAMQ
jgi:hypothetical protein